MHAGEPGSPWLESCDQIIIVALHVALQEGLGSYILSSVNLER